MKDYLELGKNGQLTLPPWICREAKIQKGDLLKEVIEEDGSIHLIPLNAEQQELKESNEYGTRGRKPKTNRSATRSTRV